jgi:uncharacterized membrane protein
MKENEYNPGRELKRAFLFFAFWTCFFIVVWSLCSCSSVKKSQQHTIIKHDSVSTESKTTASIKTVDSTAKTQQYIISKGSTVIELDDDNGNGALIWKHDSIDAKEYAPVKKPVKNIIHLPGGQKIETSQNIKSISGNWIYIDSSINETTLHKKDTAGAAEIKNVSVHDSNESTASKKSKTNWNALIFSCVLIILLIIVVKKYYNKFF